MVKEELERKKSALRQYKGYEQELSSIQYKIKELEVKIRSIRAKQLSDMPQTPFTVKGGNEAIDKLIDLKTEYELLHSKAIEACRRIENMINNLEDPGHRALLRYRYINHLSWDDVAEKIPCSKAYVHQLHLEILEKIKLLD